MNISEGKLLALVCTLANMLCPTQLYVFPWPSSVFFLSLCFTVTFAIFFILFIVTALPMPGWKRCLSVFYCIILPFDLVMLNRMSFNVESAKSVLLFKVSAINVQEFLCKHSHKPKDQKCFTWLVGATVNLTATLCCDNIMTCPLQVFGRCYVVLGWHILYKIHLYYFIYVPVSVEYVFCFFKLSTLYAICTTNATDRHLLYSPWDTDVLSSVQMIATTCVVALWLSIKWLSNHTNLN